MSYGCILYYITDRSAFPGDERARRLRLLDKIAEAASAGVDYIQLREKDLPARELESLARDAMRIVRTLRTENGKPGTALLINSRTDVALVTGADGVHLPASDISPEEVRSAWKQGMCGAGMSGEGMSGAGIHAREISPEAPLISMSCHSPEEVMQAAVNHATLALFAPVFEKQSVPRAAVQGLEALREACCAKIPVLALGGITLVNAESCRQAGAAGLAAIRLFQENDVAAIVRALR